MTHPILPNWFRADNLTPIKYHRYTSLVTGEFYRIQNINSEDATIFKEELAVFQALKDKAMAMHMDIGEDDKPDVRTRQWDNKIVLECLVNDTADTIFVGYKDWSYVIGAGVTSDSWIKPYPYIENIMDFWVGKNINSPTLTICHKDLKDATDDSLYKKICPACKTGWLLVRRDNNPPHSIIANDNCILCGQQVIYSDITEIESQERVNAKLKP